MANNANDGHDAPFEISLEGENTGEKWVGSFRAKKRLSHRDQLRKDQIRRELLGGQSGTPTDRALSTSMILAELAVRLSSSPDWWKAKGEGLDLDDDNVIGTIYDKAVAIENEATAALKKKAQDALDAMRKEAATQADTAGSGETAK